MRIGARTLWRPQRRLVRVPLDLDQALSDAPPALPRLPEGAHGFLVTSLPAAAVSGVRAAQPKLRGFVRQAYSRHYATLGTGFDVWFAGLSGRSRSDLKRKLRRIAEQNGALLDVRCYRRPEQIDEYLRHAGSVSAETYQEKRLGAGLPRDPSSVDEMRALAAADRLRGFILFIEDRPVAYLHAPAQADTLVYAFLGYDPEFAPLSPGTVLQLEAMRRLMAEGRFRRFDFTEGEGRHKKLFATGSVDCVDLLLVRPTPSNLAIAHLLGAFDRAVAGAKALGLESLARRLRR